MQVLRWPGLNLYLPLVHLFDHFISDGNEPIALDSWGEVELTGLHAPLLTRWLLAALHVQDEGVLDSVEALELVFRLSGRLVANVEGGLLRNRKQI